MPEKAANLVSKRTAQEILDLLRKRNGQAIVGTENQIAVSGGAGEPATLSFASELPFYLLVNGEITGILMPYRFQ